MTLDVIVESADINFEPKNEVEEVLQNVRTILTTVKGTCVLDRSFGIDASFLDAPTNVARTLMLKSVAEAVQEFEARAKVKEVIFNGNEDGEMQVKVRIETKNDS